MACLITCSPISISDDSVFRTNLSNPSRFVHTTRCARYQKGPWRGPSFTWRRERDVFGSSLSLTLRAHALRASLRLSKFVPDEFVEPESVRPHHSLRQIQERPLAGPLLYLAERVGCVRLILEPHPSRSRAQGQPAAVQIRSRRICRTRVGSSTPLAAPDTRKAPGGASLVSGGESGIRTHGRLAPAAVFKTAALNHSAISPKIVLPPPAV